MRLQCQSLITPFMFLFLCVSPPLCAQPFSELVVFGDSHSDVGNLPYGRFSDKMNWVDALALQLDLPLTQPSKQGGLNFAVGGATTGIGFDILGVYTIPRLGQQIETYLSQSLPSDERLFAVLIGHNDFGWNAEQSVDGPLDRLATHLNTLIDAGARRLLVANLPPLAHMPAYRGTLSESSLSKLIPEFNTGLANLLDMTAQSRDVQIFPVDFFGMVNEMISNPANSGMVDVTSGASSVAGADPNEYLYWDNEHFTTAAYSELGQRAADAIPNYFKAKSLPLVEREGTWRYFAGTAEPSAFPELAWTTASFDDSGWKTGAEGFGYGRADDLDHIRTPLDNMKGNFSTLYTRHGFAVMDPEHFTSLKLQVDYDDAFIAYINGVEVARSGYGTTGEPAPFDTTVSPIFHEAGFRDLVEIDLADYPELLSPGDNNVIAIQGLNRTPTDSDFVLAQLRLTGVMVRGDFNNNRMLDVEDIDLLSIEVGSHQNAGEFDVDEDGLVNSNDRWIWIHHLKHTWFGDADLNGEFKSGDMVQVFAAGKYETGEDAGWAEGDWNGDGIFDSSDMVTAFADGGYEQGPRTDAAAVPEPGALALSVIGLALWMVGRPTRRAV